MRAGSKAPDGTSFPILAMMLEITPPPLAIDHGDPLSFYADHFHLYPHFPPLGVLCEMHAFSLQKSSQFAMVLDLFLSPPFKLFGLAFPPSSVPLPPNCTYLFRTY